MPKPAIEDPELAMTEKLVRYKFGATKFPVVKFWYKVKYKLVEE